MYQSFHRLFQKNIIKLHARFCNSNIQIFSYGSILTFRMPGLWNSQFCLSHIFKCISHILAFTQMYLLIFVFLTIRESQFQKLPVLVLPVLSFPVGSSQFCLSQFHAVTTWRLTSQNHQQRSLKGLIEFCRDQADQELKSSQECIEMEESDRKSIIGIHVKWPI